MPHNPEDQNQLATVWRWRPRRGFPLRRRRVQTQRLGGKKPRRRMAAVVNVFRKMKLICMMRRLKECYRKVMKDMAEARASVEQYHQMLFMEASFGVPVGITFSGIYPCRFGPDHHRQPRTLFM